MFGVVRDDWPYALECDHESARSIECWRIELDARIDGVPDDQIVYESAELTRLETAPQEFSDKDAEEIAVQAENGVVYLEWKCPVCHETHDKEFTREDFIDD